MSDPWDGLLDPDERILWQGRPDPAIKLEWGHPLGAFLALFVTGFSVFWMNGAAQAGGFFWMFGLLFFAIGLYMLAGVHFWKAFVRRRTHYTLTNKRA
ncbi:MAG: aspartate carbamoyltransferase catalytic subunit, partial [Pseudomonadota bacterium]